MNRAQLIKRKMFSNSCRSSSVEDIFTTPLTSPSTSRHSLTSIKTIYESAIDMTEFLESSNVSDSDEEQVLMKEKKRLSVNNLSNSNNINSPACLMDPAQVFLVNDEETLHNNTVTGNVFQLDTTVQLLSDGCTSLSGSEEIILDMAIPEDIDKRVTENKDPKIIKQMFLNDHTKVEDKEKQYVADIKIGSFCNTKQISEGDFIFDKEDIFKKCQNKNSENGAFIVQMEFIYDRMNGICIDMSKYVPLAMSFSSVPCDIKEDISPKEIFKFLQEKKGNGSITEFLNIHFNTKVDQVNLFKNVQSKIFMFFFLILCDACKSFSESFSEEDKNLSNTLHVNLEKWLEEIKQIFEVLLNTSYIHIKFSDINTNALEQSFSAFRSVVIEDSLKEMKRLRKKMAGIPSLKEKVFICVSIIMFLVDIATDVIQTITYHNEGNTLWPLIAAFIIIPSLLGTIVCFAYWRRENPKTTKEVRLKRLGIVMIPLQLGEVWQHVCRMFDKHSILDSYTALSLLLMQMLEGIFEGGPQALVQTYVLFGQDVTCFSFQTFLHVASPLLSSLSIAIAITNIDFGRLSITVSFKTKITFILCRLGEVLARFIVYVGIFYSFGIHGLILIFAQVILLMIPTFIIIRRDHVKRQSKDVNCVYFRCRHGGFNKLTPTHVFNTNIVRLFVWIAIPFLYSLVPLQRFELDFECNGALSKRPPFWKCSRHFAVFNLVYAMHHIFNITAFVFWLIAGSITNHDLLIPLCVLFVFGTLSSLVIRIQSWVGRTYDITVKDTTIRWHHTKSQDPQNEPIQARM